MTSDTEDALAMIDNGSDIERADNDVGDAKVVRKRKKSQKALLQEETEALRDIVATYNGRWLCWRVLERAGIYQENGCTEDLSMAKREGRRAIGIWLLTELLTAEPNVYTQMRNEAVDRVSRDTSSK